MCAAPQTTPLCTENGLPWEGTNPRRLHLLHWTPRPTSPDTHHDTSRLKLRRPRRHVSHSGRLRLPPHCLLLNRPPPPFQTKGRPPCLTKRPMCNGRLRSPGHVANVDTERPFMVTSHHCCAAGAYSNTLQCHKSLHHWRSMSARQNIIMQFSRLRDPAGASYVVFC